MITKKTYKMRDVSDKKEQTAIGHCKDSKFELSNKNKLSQKRERELKRCERCELQISMSRAETEEIPTFSVYTYYDDTYVPFIRNII